MTMSRGSCVGTIVSHFRFTRLIGEGGMGEVYEGIDTLLDRKVAIKTVRQEHRFNEVSRARFFREARILSSLDHPHICRVYEYIEGDDVDFLVLEFIEGSSLKEALKTGVDDGQKMAIALQVSSALVAAHERGIVHRDVKPENIQLTGDGSVKVLDFGLSRVVEESDAISDSVTPGDGRPTSVACKGTDSEQTLAIQGQSSSSRVESFGRDDSASKTRTHEMLGTPTYMSPEQVACEEVTTASDMFSFGLVLHELFTGEKAFDRTMELTALLLHIHQGQYREAHGIDADLGALIEALKSKDPQNRPTAGETVRRLQWIKDKPKRRHRRLALSASMAFLVVIALVLGFLSLRLKSEAERASHEAHAAQQVTRFLEDLFHVSAPTESLGEEVTAREMLDRGAARLETSLTDVPETRGRLMSEIGRIYRNLGHYEEAEDLLSRALEIQLSELPSRHIDVIDTQFNLGRLYALTKRHTEAIQVLEPIFDTLEQFYGRTDPGFVEVGSMLAKIYQEQGNPRGAELFVEMVKICDSAPESRTLIDTLHNLGLFALNTGDVEHAALLIGRARELGERLLAADDPDMGTIHATLADIYVTLGRYDDAEKLLIRSLEIHEKVLGSEHDEVAKRLGTLASFYARFGRYDEAEPYFVRARAIAVQNFGPDHLFTAAISTNLATIYTDRARYPEAEAMTKSALAIYREKAPAHPGMSILIANLGTIYLATDCLEKAEAAFVEALKFLERHTPTDRVNRGIFTTNLAETCLKLGRLDRAEELYAEAYELIGQALGFQHYAIGEILRGTALVHLELGKVDEAHLTVQRAGKILNATLGRNHVLFAQNLFAHGRINLARGDAEAALPMLRETIQTLESTWGTDNPDLIPVLEVYRSALATQGSETGEIDRRIHRLQGGG
ncbi:MAG: tetratricopeptide repeat protein [Thermoanaerobaculales bacterium]|nr:tetratricopeptide repeat protein [Thermoanaerobaculales bacterium]